MWLTPLVGSSWLHSPLFLSTPVQRSPWKLGQLGLSILLAGLPDSARAHADDSEIEGILPLSTSFVVGAP